MDKNFGGHSAGEVYGEKTLTEYTGKNKHGHHTWKWLCGACDNVYGPSTISHLKRNVRCELCSKLRQNNPRWKGYKDISGVLISSIMSGAVSRSINWNITPQYMWDVWEMQKGQCAYTNIKLTFGSGSTGTASLDRIDSSLGYVPGNIQWVHKDINKMKNNYSEEYFIFLCKLVSIARQ